MRWYSSCPLSVQGRYNCVQCCAVWCSCYMALLCSQLFGVSSAVTFASWRYSIFVNRQQSSFRYAHRNTQWKHVSKSLYRVNFKRRGIRRCRLRVTFVRTFLLSSSIHPWVHPIVHPVHVRWWEPVGRFLHLYKLKSTMW